ncbi:MAG: glycerol-3-phosphate responsive antiterminator [Clostridia bacterium]|nr:glycerol-3-phosphate responsive antiterminator [Clostridia bacterium]
MYPVIPAVRRNEELGPALDSPSEIVFLLKSSIFDLRDALGAVHKAGKKLFVHADFTDGVSRDVHGVNFLRGIGCDGMISTRANLVKYASEAGLCSVGRYFIIDSRATGTALESISQTHPSMIEVMPGVIPKVITHFASELSIPVIAGGLIESEREVRAAVDAGASAVSTSRTELWNIY